MVKFTWHESLDESRMKISAKFEELHPVSKLDFIQDMMYHLEQLQIKAHNECYQTKEV
jgi:hypothetical protein